MERDFYRVSWVAGLGEPALTTYDANFETWPEALVYVSQLFECFGTVEHFWPGRGVRLVLDFCTFGLSGRGARAGQWRPLPPETVEAHRIGAPFLQPHPHIEGRFDPAPLPLGA